MEHRSDDNLPDLAFWFEELETWLQDPSRVTSQLFCVVCNLGTGVILQQDLPALRPLLRKSHGLWNACVRQLVAPRTPEQESRLRTDLQRNIDNCGAAVIHDGCIVDSKKQHITDPLVLFNSFLCIFLSSCIHAGPTESNVLARAQNPHKRFPSSTGLWPSDPEQLFPYGTTQTVSALVKACEAWEDDGPWWILSAVVLLARPRLTDLLFADTAIRARLSKAIQAFLFYGTPRQPARDTSWLRSGCGLRSVASLLVTLHHGSYARADDMDRFLAPEMSVFGDAYAVAVERYAQTGAEEWQEILVCLTPAAAHFQHARAKVSDEQVLELVTRAPRSWAVLEAIRTAVAGLHSEQYCCGPDCAQSTLDHSGGRPPLPTCSRCKVPRYCGAECQRADWKRAHKKLCGPFSQLRDLFDAPEYMARVRQSAISDQDLIHLGHWAVSRGVRYRDVICTDFVFPNLFAPSKSHDETLPPAP